MGSLVSIIIPCFNAERYVGQAIQSALQQTYRPIEVIVIDDGSTDGSLDVIRRFGSMVQWETGQNRGGCAARNRGIAKARGEFIQFLDADDSLVPGKLNRCMVEFSDAVDMVFCDHAETRGYEVDLVSFSPVGEDLFQYFLDSSVVTTLPLHRGSCLRLANGFDERLPCCQEYELHLRLARRHWRKIVHIAEPLCTIVKVPDSVSSNEARIYSWKAKIVAELYESLSRDGELTPSRLMAIGGVLNNCGRHLARHGSDDEAQRVFELARQVAPGTVGSRWPMRALAGAVGPVRAEKYRTSLYRALGRRL